MPDGVALGVGAVLADITEHLRSDEEPRRGEALPRRLVESEGDVRRSHEAGFVAHPTKPVDFRRLEEAIGRLGLGRSGLHQSTTEPSSASYDS